MLSYYKERIFDEIRKNIILRGTIMSDMSETFSGILKQWQTGKYERNGITCDAKVVYVREKADGENTFAVIRKEKCPWDKKSDGKSVGESYSICWEISGEKYLLGLPVDPQIIDKLEVILQIIMLTDKISQNS